MTRLIEFRDKMKKQGFTTEQMLVINRKRHIDLKKMYGLENLHFYKVNGRSRCKYISGPEVFDYENSMDNMNLEFLLKAFSLQQGLVYFDDYGRLVTGLDQLKELYLPMKLAGL